VFYAALQLLLLLLLLLLSLLLQLLLELRPCSPASHNGAAVLHRHQVH
jgi:hypothetical protein